MSLPFCRSRKPLMLFFALLILLTAFAAYLLLTGLSTGPPLVNPNGSSSTEMSQETPTCDAPNSAQAGLWRPVNVVVISAMESATSVNSFEFRRCRLDNRFLLQREDYFTLEESILSYSATPRTIRSLLRPLIKRAEKFVADGNSKTKSYILFRATSTLRDLLQKNTLERMLLRVRKILRNSPFHMRPQSVSVIQESDEAADLWLSAMFLTGRLHDKNATDLAIADLSDGLLRVAVPLSTSSVQPRNKSEKEEEEEEEDDDEEEEKRPRTRKKREVREERNFKAGNGPDYGMRLFTGETEKAMEERQINGRDEERENIETSKINRGNRRHYYFNYRKRLYYDDRSYDDRLYDDISYDNRSYDDRLYDDRSLFDKKTLNSEERLYGFVSSHYNLTSKPKVTHLKVSSNNSLVLKPFSNFFDKDDKNLKSSANMKKRNLIYYSKDGKLKPPYSLPKMKPKSHFLSSLFNYNFTKTNEPKIGQIKNVFLDDNVIKSEMLGNLKIPKQFNTKVLEKIFKNISINFQKQIPKNNLERTELKNVKYKELDFNYSSEIFWSDMSERKSEAVQNYSLINATSGEYKYQNTNPLWKNYVHKGKENMENREKKLPSKKSKPEDQSNANLQGRKEISKRRKSGYWNKMKCLKVTHEIATIKKRKLKVETQEKYSSADFSFSGLRQNNSAEYGKRASPKKKIVKMYFKNDDDFKGGESYKDESNKRRKPRVIPNSLNFNQNERLLEASKANLGRNLHGLNKNSAGKCNQENATIRIKQGESDNLEDMIQVKGENKIKQHNNVKIRNREIIKERKKNAKLRGRIHNDHRYDKTKRQASNQLAKTQNERTKIFRKACNNKNNNNNNNNLNVNNVAEIFVRERENLNKPETCRRGKTSRVHVHITSLRAVFQKSWRKNKIFGQKFQQRDGTKWKEKLILSLSKGNRAIGKTTGVLKDKERSERKEKRLEREKEIAKKIRFNTEKMGSKMDYYAEKIFRTKNFTKQKIGSKGHKDAIRNGNFSQDNIILEHNAKVLKNERKIVNLPIVVKGKLCTSTEKMIFLDTVKNYMDKKYENRVSSITSGIFFSAWRPRIISLILRSNHDKASSPTPSDSIPMNIKGINQTQKSRKAKVGSKGELPHLGSQNYIQDHQNYIEIINLKLLNIFHRNQSLENDKCSEVANNFGECSKHLRFASGRTRIKFPSNKLKQGTLIQTANGRRRRYVPPDDITPVFSSQFLSKNLLDLEWRKKNFTSSISEIRINSSDGKLRNNADATVKRHKRKVGNSQNRISTDNIISRYFAGKNFRLYSLSIPLGVYPARVSVLLGSISSATSVHFNSSQNGTPSAGKVSHAEPPSRPHRRRSDIPPEEAYNLNQTLHSDAAPFREPRGLGSPFRGAAENENKIPQMTSSTAAYSLYHEDEERNEPSGPVIATAGKIYLRQGTTDSSGVDGEEDINTAFSPSSIVPMWSQDTLYKVKGVVDSVLLALRSTWRVSTDHGRNAVTAGRSVIHNRNTAKTVSINNFSKTGYIDEEVDRKEMDRNSDNNENIINNYDNEYDHNNFTNKNNDYSPDSKRNSKDKTNITAGLAKKGNKTERIIANPTYKNEMLKKAPYEINFKKLLNRYGVKNNNSVNSTLFSSGRQQVDANSDDDDVSSSYGRPEVVAKSNFHSSSSSTLSSLSDTVTNKSSGYFGSSEVTVNDSTHKAVFSSAFIDGLDEVADDIASSVTSGGQTAASVQEISVPVNFHVIPFLQQINSGLILQENVSKLHLEREIQSRNQRNRRSLITEYPKKVIDDRKATSISDKREENRKLPSSFRNFAFADFGEQEAKRSGSRHEKSTKRQKRLTTFNKQMGQQLIASFCLPEGTVGRLTADDKIYLVVGATGGANRKKKCWREVVRMIYRHASLPSMNGKEFLGSSAFYFLASKANLIHSNSDIGFAKVSQFKAAADELCDRKSELRNDPLSCLDYQFIAALLLRGFSIPPDQEIMVGDTIGGFRISDALGAALYFLQRHR